MTATPTGPETLGTPDGDRPVNIDPALSVLDQARAAGEGSLEGFSYRQGDSTFIVRDEFDGNTHRMEPKLRGLPPGLVDSSQTRNPFRRIQIHLASYSGQQFHNPVSGIDIHASHKNVPAEVETTYIVVEQFGPDGEPRGREQYEALAYEAMLQKNSQPDADEQDKISGFRIKAKKSDEADEGSTPHTPEAHTPEAKTRTIDIDLKDTKRSKDDPAKKSVMEIVLDTVDREGLEEGLVGLTWERDGGAFKFEVVADSYFTDPKDGHKADKTFSTPKYKLPTAEDDPEVKLLWTKKRHVNRQGRPGPGGNPIEHRKLNKDDPLYREFEIKMTDTDGRVISHRTKNAEELAKLFEVMNTPSKQAGGHEPLEIKFVVPKSAGEAGDPHESPTEEIPTDPYEAWFLAEAAARLGHTAIEEDPDDDDTPEVSGETLSDNEAADLLMFGSDGPDDEIEPEDLEKARAQVKTKFGLRMEALQTMVAEIGLADLKGIAKHMQEQYYATILKLDLKGFPSDGRDAWIYLELAQRRLLSDNPDRFNSEGREVHNPVAKNSSARLTRIEAVDMRVAEAFIAEAVKSQEVPAEKIEKIPPSERKGANPDEFRKVIKAQVVTKVDDELVKRLPFNIRADVSSLIEKMETSKKGEAGEKLTPAEVAKVGKLIGRGIKERLTK